ncbi:ABC transporter substrate-binding protein [Sphingobacterium sp. lm-10]|uniref:siderophore ABC transporter substrate-binding protein n=1 Tax=Sphingobacterium sp. lm-10 TaxID=2944904 RepID=UPI0020223F34|nr:ABC transporter substrate-binding protein [Sphingobacterium sp. lm-10]MCL7988192.1 ABC transporter substrate-binding protein [Sphingobacterium sp. lm-10]
MKNTINTLILIAGLLCLLQPGMAQQKPKNVTISHSKGNTEVPVGAAKVVIFDLGTLETFHELGIPVAGVPNSVPDYLSEFKQDKYAKVGGIKGPNIQAIAALSPDLIIISGRQSDSYDSLSMIAPTLFLGVDSKDYWATFEGNVQKIAAIYGREDLAEKKLTTLRNKRDAVREKSATDEKTGIIVLHVRGGHTAYGTQSRFGFIHDVLGIRQAMPLNDATHTGHRFKEDDQLITKAAADYLFLIDRDSAVGGEKKDKDELLSQEIKNSKAYQANKIIELSGNVWYTSGGGLTSVDKMISEVGTQLYQISF